LLDDPCPKIIELSVIVNGRCIHKKGQTYGQLRGVARDAALQEFANAGKKPTEFAKASLSKASDSEYHSKNHGALVTKASAQNISQEAKQKELSYRIGSNKMQTVQHTTGERDYRDKRY
jgi:hypothetical protein